MPTIRVEGTAVEMSVGAAIDTGTTLVRHLLMLLLYSAHFCYPDLSPKLGRRRHRECLPPCPGSSLPCSPLISALFRAGPF